jgi:hypothetical protein
MTSSADAPLPEGLLWDVDPSDVSWTEHRDFLLRRVLSRGSWQQICSLRGRVGDQELRDYLVRSRGRGLSPRQLRFWETILDLDHDQVSGWIAEERRRVWDHR